MYIAYNLTLRVKLLTILFLPYLYFYLLFQFIPRSIGVITGLAGYGVKKYTNLYVDRTTHAGSEV